MAQAKWFDWIPLWGVFLFAGALILLSFVLGTWLAIRGGKRQEKPQGSLGTVCGALLGLLAFMLAFTFGISAQRFQTARLFLLDEVNAIETTYLRAGLLAQPHPAEIRRLIREYVDMRVELMSGSAAWTERLPQVLARSEALQGQLWDHASALAQADRYSPIDALFISSLNEMIDLQTSRVTVFAYRIPRIVWECLFLIMLLSVFLTGYQAGLSMKGGFKVGLVLALTFAAVILLIADLDRGWGGRLRVGQQPILDLQSRIQDQIK
ncbi:MAG: hypothetical protein LLF76_07855 [Planctomycetaceae bacterium]|nr:hypothetical protein [Planctomycetaceae bacterium]